LEVKYKKTTSATVAAILSSSPCIGNSARAPPRPNIPNNGIVQTGHPDATAVPKKQKLIEKIENAKK